MKIEGAHAVITGGGTGIGAAISRSLTQAGAKVTLLGRRAGPLEAVAEECGASFTTCDVTEPEQVRMAMQHARERNGAIDILVNNAGAAATAPFHKTSAEEWRAAMAVNCDGVFHCTRAVIEPMLARGEGRIVTIASTAGLEGVPYASGYSAAKHAVIGLMRSIALETDARGVTANAVCPGFVETDMLTRSLETIRDKTGRSEEEARAQLASFNASGRLITPQEVAQCVADLIPTQRNGEAIELS